MGRVPKTDRIEFATPKKARFRALVKDTGWSQSSAAIKVGISQATGSRWLRQAEERRTGRSRTGRPRKLTPQILEEIDKWFTGHYDHRIQSLQDIIKDCSPATLWRALNKQGFHKHTPELKVWIGPKAREQRLEFALKHQNKSKSYWRKGLYTDESTFNTRILRRLKVWRKKGERQRLDCIQFKFHQGRQSVSA
jgi:transposase